MDDDNQAAAGLKRRRTGTGEEAEGVFGGEVGCVCRWGPGVKCEKTALLVLVVVLSWRKKIKINVKIKTSFAHLAKTLGMPNFASNPPKWTSCTRGPAAASHTRTLHAMPGTHTRWMSLFIGWRWYEP